jgi:hypothetical protein
MQLQCFSTIIFISRDTRAVSILRCIGLRVPSRTRTANNVLHKRAGPEPYNTEPRLERSRWRLAGARRVSTKHGWISNLEAQNLVLRFVYSFARYARAALFGNGHLEKARAAGGSQLQHHQLDSRLRIASLTVSTLVPSEVSACQLSLLACFGVALRSFHVGKHPDITPTVHYNLNWVHCKHSQLEARNFVFYPSHRILYCTHELRLLRVHLSLLGWQSHHSEL